jgi:hypothetical protein
MVSATAGDAEVHRSSFRTKKGDYREQHSSDWPNKERSRHRGFHLAIMLIARHQIDKCNPCEQTNEVTYYTQAQRHGNSFEDRHSMILSQNKNAKETHVEGPQTQRIPVVGMFYDNIGQQEKSV